jgi:hypothetical protein
MPCILQNEENRDLDAYLLPRWEGNASIYSAHFCHGMEEPYLRELDAEVTEEDEFCALPLLQGGGDLGALDLVSVENGWKGIDYDPRQTATKIYYFVHDETHDSRCEDIVLHVEVPTSPKALEYVELNIVLGELIVDFEIGSWVCEVGVQS